MAEVVAGELVRAMALLVPEHDCRRGVWENLDPVRSGTAEALPQREHAGHIALGLG